MKSKRIELEKKLIDKKDEIGLVKTKLDLNEVSGDSVSASILPDWSRITINYGRDLNLIPDKETENFTKKVNIKDPELALGLDLVHHETGHRENPADTTLGFPFIIDIHDSIKESIYKALAEKGKQSNTSYVTNSFEDIFDNSNCKTKTDFYGQTLFWNNQGIAKANSEKFSEFYETFVKLNLILGGDVISYNFLKRFFENTDKSKKAKEGFIKDLKERLGLESIVKFHRGEGFNQVFNKDLEQREKIASELGYIFAKNMADLLKETPPQEQLFGAGSSEDGNSDEYNPFDKIMKDPEIVQGIAYKRYKKGKGPALHRDKKEQLFDLYRAISKEIQVKTSEYSTSESMPLIHFGTKPFTEEDNKLRFRGIGINDKGNFYVKTSRYSIEEPASYKIHPRNFPKLKICLMDRSGSMRLNPDNESSGLEPINIGDTSFIPWGDNSKYHYALKGKFGIDNFLERQGIANYVRDVALGWSGEAPLQGNYKEVSKSLLETPTGSTSFDIDNLEKLLDRKAIVLSLSDAEFSLDKDTKKRLDKKLSECDMVHIQIGYKKDSKGNIIKNEYCKYLESKEKPVIYVKGDNDLSNAMIDFVSKYYKSLSGGQIK
jgi:hypothetical protein